MFRVIKERNFKDKYADDICLMAPSPVALQELIDIC